MKFERKTGVLQEMPLFVVGVPDPDFCTGGHWTVTDEKAFKSRKDFIWRISIIFASDTHTIITGFLGVSRTLL